MVPDLELREHVCYPRRGRASSLLPCPTGPAPSEADLRHCPQGRGGVPSATLPSGPGGCPICDTALRARGVSHLRHCPQGRGGVPSAALPQGQGGVPSAALPSGLGGCPWAVGGSPSLPSVPALSAGLSTPRARAAGHYLTASASCALHRPHLPSPPPPPAVSPNFSRFTPALLLCSLLAPWAVPTSASAHLYRCRGCRQA